MIKNSETPRYSRYAALARLQFTTGEIAEREGVSYQSVRKGLMRLGVRAGSAKPQPAAARRRRLSLKQAGLE